MMNRLLRESYLKADNSLFQHKRVKEKMTMLSKVLKYGAISIVMFVLGLIAAAALLIWVVWDGFTAPPECVLLAEEAGMPSEVVLYLADPHNISTRDKLIIRSALEITETDDLCAWIDQQPLATVKQLAEQLRTLKADTLTIPTAIPDSEEIKSKALDLLKRE